MRVLTRESRPAVAALLTAILLATTPTDSRAQPAAQAAAVGANENVFQVVTPRSELQIIEQFSRVFECPNRIIRVDGFDPDVITVSALSPNRVRVLGEKTGVTTLVITDEYDNAYLIEVFVAGDVRHLQAYLKQLFPEDDIEAVKLNDSIVLRGVVTEPSHITQIVDVALEFSTKVLNQMEVGGVHQVQLNVKVMEVNRQKVRSLGFNFDVLSADGFVNFAPTSLQETVRFAVLGSGTEFFGFVEALREENLLKILAEPQLVTTSGRPASILSGGEFPLPVAQGLGQVTLQWKEYGVRMEAVPIVLGNGRLRLDVAPEVSERDFTVGQTVNGQLTPGLKTRRVNTQVEMRFGETLMIGGLISSNKIGETRKIPFFGELPWIGAAFRKVKFSDSESELMVLVTPHMVAPMQPHQVPPLGPGQFTDDPTDCELFLDGMLEVPLYGPECEGCNTLGMGAYNGGGYGAGGYGGSGGFCGNGNGCGPTASVQEGFMLPQPGQNPGMYTPVEGMPADGQHYESTEPAFEPSIPEEATVDPESARFDASPQLPPLPGQAQSTTQPTSGSNRPATLGLIDPFRSRVRTGEVPVDVRSQRLQANPTGQGGQTIQRAGHSQPQQTAAQSSSTSRSPWSLR